MLFSEMLNIWPSKKKGKAIDLLCQFGNADEIIAYIDNISYKYQDGKRTIMVDKKFYVDYDDEKMTLFPTDSIKYCFRCNGLIGLLLKEEIYWLPIDFKNALNGQVDNDKYEFLCKILPCVEQEPYCPCSFHVKGCYGINVKIENGKFISYRERNSLFSAKTKQTILFETDVSNVVWCYQSSTYNAENYEDEFSVSVFFRNGNRVIVKLCDSESPEGYINSLNFLLHLKKNVRHLLFGEIDEYKKIFKKSPEKLFEIANQK